MQARRTISMSLASRPTARAPFSAAWMSRSASGSSVRIFLESTVQRVPVFTLVAMMALLVRKTSMDKYPSGPAAMPVPGRP